MRRFSSATQNAVDAGISAEETRLFLREAIGASNLARRLLDAGQTERAQQILDRYDKGATLADLHTQLRGWGHSDWVNEELTRLSAYESIISSFASQYSQSMAGAASQTARSAMQSIVERIRSVDDLAKQKLEELRKEDTEEKKLSPEEKRKKLREDAEKMLREEEEGEKKTGKKAPEPAPIDLAEAKTIKAEMREEVEGIDKVRKNILRKTTLDEMFKDPKFDDIFEQHRGEEIKEMVTRKYFKSGMVPVKVLDAIANIRPPDVASYGPVSQLGLLRAYRKSLEEYSQQLRTN
jgi:vacuolar-type H+-ATPase subunit I/STV1